MDVFFTLLSKILPLYLLIAAGFFAGARLQVTRESVANLMIYIISPVVFFGALAKATLMPGATVLPFVFYAFCCLLGLCWFLLARHVWGDGRANLAGYMMGTSNQGYFGIPVFLALFGPEHLGIYVLAGLGYPLYEATFGYYLMARGTYGVKESLRRLARLPLLPGALLGLAFNFAGMEFSAGMEEMYTVFKGAYTVLGMMMIGLGLSRLHHLKADPKFLLYILAGKFAVWPLCGLLIVAGYGFIYGPMPEYLSSAVMLLTILPVAANAVAYAASLKVEPDRAAMVVVLSTLFALFYIPLILLLI